MSINKFTIGMDRTAVLLLSAVFFACNPLKKMVKRAGEVNYAVTPNPLEMHGDTITMNLSGSFPTKYFHKKVKGVVTPVLKYNGGETNFAPITLKGEAVEGDGVVISYANGGKFSHTAKIPYQSGMEKAELYLSLEGFFKSKSKKFDPVKVADGTIITPKLVKSDDKAILAKDNFSPVHPINIYADIHYIVNTSTPVNGDLNKEDIRKMKEGVKKYKSQQRINIKGVKTEAYASPEGELSRNENLANERAEHGAKFAVEVLKKEKIDAARNPGFYTSIGKGEDWEGFKKLMQASQIKDKDLIIRVLEMYSDVNKREEEIRNMAETFKELKEKILPQLRRSEIWVLIDSLSRPDNEIMDLSRTNPSALTIDELLHIAYVSNDLNEKERIYKKIIEVYPNDWRGYNNLGYVYVMQNKISEARNNFEKANNLATNNAIVKNNLGVCERLSGNLKKAMEYYNAAAGAGSEVNYNKGIVYIIWGDYASAVSSFSGSSTFNAALAQLLNGNPDAAVKTIDNSPDKDSAMGYYLKAIAAARLNNVDMLVNNIKNAVSKDPSLKAKAKEDAEFIKFRNNSEFQAAVN